MKNKFLAVCLIFTILSSPTIQLKAQEVNTETSDLMPATRASKFLTATSWDLSNKFFALYFKDSSNGYGTVEMQRRVGLTASWVTVGDLEFEFTNVISFGDTIDADTSSSGTYRLYYNVTVGGVTERIYSSTKTK